MFNIEEIRARKNVVVIVGPTASGKTGIAIDLALRIGGEIVSADSRAIYRGMDIGTAKPTIEEMRGVPHFGIDLVDPDERFTVADFQEYCLARIAEIEGRGNIPIIVGGTGLYVDAVVFGYEFGASAGETQENRREMNPKFLVFGIYWDKDALDARIAERADNFFTTGVAIEAEGLLSRYSLELQSMRSNIYPIVARVLSGEIAFEVAREEFIRDDRSLAKRQRTWFKRNPWIRWMRLDEMRRYFELGKS